MSKSILEQMAEERGIASSTESTAQAILDANPGAESDGVTVSRLLDTLERLDSLEAENTARQNLQSVAYLVQCVGSLPHATQADARDRVSELIKSALGLAISTVSVLSGSASDND